MTTVMEQIRFWSPWLVNHWVWPMLWQSSLLIGLLFVIDFTLKRKLRPAVRYALWLVVLVKLVLPPSLALPTGLGWWLRPAATAPAKPHITTVTVSYGPSMMPEPITRVPAAAIPAPAPPLPTAAWALLGSSLVTIGLLVWMLIRWGQVARTADYATAAPDWLNELLTRTKACVRIRRPIRLKLIAEPMSPAVCGFYRPIILLPQALTSLPESRLRGVLLHELTHLRRGDVWVNCIQALLQILYWWHPLLWFANARIRRLREEAVDDAVMLALRDDAADYAPTLLEVARLALQRPLSSLGLVGILESKTALRRRIERLMDGRAPRKAGLTFASILGLGLFTAMAVPMGEPPATPQHFNENANPEASPWPDPRFNGYAEVRLEPQFYIADGASLRAVLPRLLDSTSPLVLSSNEVADLVAVLRQANARPASANESLNFAKFSGGTFRWQVGGTTNTIVNYQAKEVGGRTVVTGAEVGLAAIQPEWIPLDFTLVPWAEGNQLRCELGLGLSANANALERAQVLVPQQGAALWAKPVGGFSGKYELVVLRRESPLPQTPPGSTTVASSKAPVNAAPGNSTNKDASSTAPLENFLKAQTKVQDGKLLFEMGKLDEAEASLSQALILNPQSQAAQYYLNLVREARRKETERKTKVLSSKLSQIRLPEVRFENEPLSEVVEQLTRMSKHFDPEKRGVNFIINNHVDSLTTGNIGLQRPVQIDPTSSLPVPQTTAQEQDDIADASIKILPALTDVTLAETLDAIVKVADKRIKYSVEDNAVVFSIKSPGVAPLYTRIIRVDPNTLEQGLKDVIGFDWGSFAPPKPEIPRVVVNPVKGADVRGWTRTNDTVQTQLREFFLAMGVDLTPPKSIFFNDREGTLVVRASLQDLDTIEQAVQVLNITPPQIHIKAKFIAVPTELMSELQLEVPLYVPGHDNVVLSAAQRQVFLKALQSNKDVEILSESSVTTLSGRQAEIQIVSEPFGAGGTNSQPVVPGFVPEPRLTNPPPSIQLDVVAYAGRDDGKIQISGKASATEFLGYDSPDPLKPTNWDTRLLRGDAVITGQPNSPLPHFRTHEHTFTCIVGDGQTLVLGNAAPNTNSPNTVAGQSVKSLLVLITPTLIDPAGNRIHKEDQPQK